jgi:hypothetical protein
MDVMSRQRTSLAVSERARRRHVETFAGSRRNRSTLGVERAGGCDSCGMKASTSIEGLEGRIEQLVREHVAAIRTAAAAAVTRAFAEKAVRSSAPATRRPRLSERQSASRGRRTPEEVADLAERLCAAVHASPGAKITTLAAEVGATPRELIVAVGRLRRAGCVRTVGERQYTKYFAAAPTPTTAS